MGVVGGTAKRQLEPGYRSAVRVRWPTSSRSSSGIWAGNPSTTCTDLCRPCDHTPHFSLAEAPLIVPSCRRKTDTRKALTDMKRRVDDLEKHVRQLCATAAKTSQSETSQPPGIPVRDTPARASTAGDQAGVDAFEQRLQRQERPRLASEAGSVATAALISWAWDKPPCASGRSSRAC